MRPSTSSSSCMKADDSKDIAIDGRGGTFPGTGLGLPIWGRSFSKEDERKFSIAPHQKKNSVFPPRLRFGPIFWGKELSWPFYLFWGFFFPFKN